MLKKGTVEQRQKLKTSLLAASALTPGWQTQQKLEKAEKNSCRC